VVGRRAAQGSPTNLLSDKVPLRRSRSPEGGRDSGGDETERFTCFPAADGPGKTQGRMKKRIVIIAGAGGDNPDWLRRELAAAHPEAVICADGGARHARRSGVIPDLIVGDMDSLEADLQGYFATRDVPFVRHSPRKDETDTWLALERAAAMGATEITILGAMGKRLDHTLANLGLLLLGRERGISVTLRDEDCEVFVVAGRAVVRGEKGQTVSLFPLAGDARGVDLEGFEYPLTDAVLTMSRPRGISNRLLAPTGSISVKEGCLLVIHYLNIYLNI